MGSAPDTPPEFPGVAGAVFEPELPALAPLTVLTGATGLLGAALAAELVARDRAVCLMGRDPDALDELVASLGPSARVLVLRADLGVAEEVADAASFVAHLDRPVELLVHAGGLRAPARGDALDELDEHYRVNVRGPHLLTRRLLPLIPEDHGRVLFCATEADPDGGDPFGVPHAVTAAGARALAAQLRVELAPMGIRVLTATTAEPPAADGAAFLASLAAGLLDALDAPPLDVVELHARPASRGLATTRQ